LGEIFFGLMMTHASRTKVLEEHKTAEQFILVKLDEDPDMLKKLADVVKTDT
jgi:hypothetical protein